MIAPCGRISPRMALAFQEDALAIASWADSQGFPEDAAAMREFARKLDPVTAVFRRRWQEPPMKVAS